MKSVTIKELRMIMNADIDSTKKADYLTELRSMKEKCTGTKYPKCNNCDYSKDDVCIMKLFINNDSYAPAPHHGNEFGDVSFLVTYKGQTTQLMCIAKSAVPGETLTVSSKEGREMIQQILTASHDARVGIIGALCPIRFHDQLIEELRYLANILKKKMVIMDEKYMIMQLNNYYIEKEKNAKSN